MRVAARKERTVGGRLMDLAHRGFGQKRGLALYTVLAALARLLGGPDKLDEAPTATEGGIRPRVETRSNCDLLAATPSKTNATS
jgi:ABC-type phosphonate transport system ATPase subunit